MAQLTFSAPVAPQASKLRPGMYSPFTYAPTPLGFRPAAPTTVIAPSEPARFLPETPEFVEPDLFFIANRTTGEAWDAMPVGEQRNLLSRHYGISPTSALVDSFLSKYRGSRGWQPGRALAALGLTCAQWQAMDHASHTRRLMLYASPMRAVSVAVFSDYAEAVTAYCGGAVAPGGQVSTPEFVEPLTNKLTFWRVAFVLAGGTAVALGLRLRSVTRKRR